MTTTEEIRKLLEQGKLVIGQKEVRQSLSDGEAQRVLIASNAPEGEADAMRDYGAMAGVDVEVLSARNDQVGVICRKPFSIAFLAVKK